VHGSGQRVDQARTRINALKAEEARSRTPQPGRYTRYNDMLVPRVRHQVEMIGA
jgi:hypothetical protein